MRVALFGTHPTQMNGYSKVVYELMCELAKRSDIHLSIFGFQRFNNNTMHRGDIPANVHVHDAFANENPKELGFGIAQVKDFLEAQAPDVVIVYNDVLVIERILGQIDQIPDRKFKVLLYVDQVYPMQKKTYIDMINKKADGAILFTKYWQDCIVEQGVTIPTYVLEHGFNPTNYYPVPKDVARTYFGLKSSDYIVLNLNRNQARKRWDICIKAWAELVSMMPDEPIKLLIGTDVNGSWNLLEIYERELKKRDLTLEKGMKHVIMLDGAQSLSDFDINVLYNACDLGLTTCDGEGWGLCSFEQAAVGVPQVAPRLGGFLEFLDESGPAILIEPVYNYYVDSSRDAVGGEASVCNYMDFADTLKNVYDERSNVRNNAYRKHVIDKYGWNTIADKLVAIITTALAPPEVEKAVTDALPIIPEESETVEEETVVLEDIDDQCSIGSAIEADVVTNPKAEVEYVTKSEMTDMQKKLDAILAMLSMKTQT